MNGMLHGDRTAHVRSSREGCELSLSALLSGLVSPTGTEGMCQLCTLRIRVSFACVKVKIAWGSGAF